MVVVETKKLIDVPSVDEYDIEVTLKDNILTVLGKRESSVKEESDYTLIVIKNNVSHML